MKERLVGAVVLVGLIVLLVPEMLSGPRRDAETNAAADASVRTYTIDLEPAPDARAPSTPETPVEEEATPAQPLAAEPVTDSTRNAGEAATASTAGSEGTSTAPERDTPAPATERESASRAETRPRPAPEPARTSQPARTESATDSGWVVQLGSFASRDNAERLAADVRKGGYRAFVSRFESGRNVRYRVRVGPEAQRAQAEAVAQRLQRDGRQVSIVPHP